MGDRQLTVRSRALEDDSGRSVCFGLRELPDQVSFVSGITIIDLDIIHIAGRVRSIVRIEDIDAIEGQFDFASFRCRSEHHLAVKTLNDLVVLAAFVVEIRFTGNGIGRIFSHEVHRLDGEGNCISRSKWREIIGCLDAGNIHTTGSIKSGTSLNGRTQTKLIRSVAEGVRCIQGEGINACAFGYRSCQFSQRGSRSGLPRVEFDMFAFNDIRIACSKRKGLQFVRGGIPLGGDGQTGDSYILFSCPYFAIHKTIVHGSRLDRHGF